jgi:hypothetical protein
MPTSAKKYVFETIEDPATRYCFDLLSQQVSEIQNALSMINWQTSQPSSTAAVTAIYPKFSAVQPLSVPITTMGGAVALLLKPANASNNYTGNITLSNTAAGLSSIVNSAYIQFTRDGQIIYQTEIGEDTAVLPAGSVDAVYSSGSSTPATSVTVTGRYAPSRFWVIDTPQAGSHTYACNAAIVVNGQTFNFNQVALGALEIIGNLTF